MPLALEGRPDVHVLRVLHLVGRDRSSRRVRKRAVPELSLKIHELMLKGRVLEERLITMYRQGDGYFWIGGPGEEAFNVSLGLLVDKGQGLEHDYLHLHYRSSGTLLALGADPVDYLRQMKNTATDPYSRGRNFVGHATARKWNVAPISSPIEVQYSIAPGTAMAQRAVGSKGITIVQGGDAGTAEGDFATCLVWSSRKGAELPILIIVTNNRYGISTPYDGQHGEVRIAIAARPSECRRPRSTETTSRAPTPGSSARWTTSTPSGSPSPRGDGVAAPRALERERRELREGRGGLRRGLGEKRSKTEASARAPRWTRCAPATPSELLEASKRVREEPQPAGESIWEHVFASKNLVAGES